MMLITNAMQLAIIFGASMAGLIAASVAGALIEEWLELRDERRARRAS